MLGILSVLCGPILALAAIPPRDGAAVLVVAWPWNGPASALIERAGGHVVGMDQGAIAVMAASFEGGFPERLKAEGAALVLDGSRTAGICGDPE